MDKTLENIEKYLFWAVIVLFPVIVLPVFPNAYTTPKLIVLTFGVGLILLVKAARILTSQKLDLFTGKFDFPVFLLMASYITSAIMRTPNKMEAFFLPGTATLIIGGALFYFLLNQSAQTKKNISIPFLISGLVVAIVSALAIGGVLGKLPGVPELLKDVSFTTLGGNLPAFLYLIFLVPIALGLVVADDGIVKKTFSAICLFVITLGVAANLYNILPGKANFPKTPGLANSWSIAIDTLKVSPILGAGPANYITAFDLYKPLSYNSSPNWTLRFSAAENFYLTTLTEAGLLGFAALILLVVVVYRTVQKEVSERKLVGWGFAAEPNLITLIVVIVLLAIFGSDFALILPLFAYLAVNTKTNKLTLNFQAQSGEGVQKFASALPSFLVALPVVLATLAFGFFATKAIAAEVTFKNAIDAVNKNDGTAAYNLITSAIKQNSLVDRYHASFSQINFAIANTMAQKPEGQEVSEQEKTTITTLIQQSISEGKAAVALNPSRADNWSLLGSLYRSIMAFAEGSDQYAVQAYTQAIALNPLDTNLRISLGGIYYAMGDYDSAIDTFKMAVMTKADNANARYNLAVAYRDKGEIEKAITEMTNVLSLVDKDSQDYTTAKAELDALEAKKPVAKQTTTTEESETLTTPQPTTESAIEPPIELPAESAPEVSPTPVAESTPATAEP